jgi:hypothetical protein
MHLIISRYSGTNFSETSTSSGQRYCQFRFSGVISWSLMTISLEINCINTYEFEVLIDRVHWDVSPKEIKHGEEGIGASIWHDGS